VTAGGFWQVHREAPRLLLDAVAAALQETELEGASVFDLYSGAGLFTPLLAGLVGGGGRVLAVEGDRRAATDARRNAHDLPQVELAAGDVEHALATAPVDRAAAVVLDPPRVGAGSTVVGQIATLRPDVVVYVACDPAALARDVATFTSHGYRLDYLRAFDLFPMTHHVECVARLVRSP
jgi:tRNA/tmRNA/rRNA uracil-C5-methylase (TrmA/RlmC/RlmD family)